MSRKKTVKLNLPVVDKLIKEHCRSNVVFCEKMGRPNHKTWVTDWHRVDKDGNPAPKSFPSPEEASKMCLLLDTTPEDILTEPADIELVKGLIEKEREKNIKKDLPQGEVELTDTQKEAWELIQKWDDEKLKKFIAAAKAMLGE